MMNRYARVDLSAGAPKQILGVIETDGFEDGPGLLDISNSPEVTVASWYWASKSLWVIAPPSQAYEWDGAAWTLNSDLQAAYAASRLNETYQGRLQALNAACEASITSGFWSEALGARYLYSSQLDDQLNLTGIILAGADSLYACRDEAGVKEFRPHTLQQLRQVGDDFTAFKLQQLQKANTLKQLLEQALDSGDLAGLEAITWESPQ